MDFIHYNSSVVKEYGRYTLGFWTGYSRKNETHFFNGSSEAVNLLDLNRETTFLEFRPRVVAIFDNDQMRLKNWVMGCSFLQKLVLRTSL